MRALGFLRALRVLRGKCHWSFPRSGVLRRHRPRHDIAPGPAFAPDVDPAEHLDGGLAAVLLAELGGDGGRTAIVRNVRVSRSAGVGAPWSTSFTHTSAAGSGGTTFPHRATAFAEALIGDGCASAQCIPLPCIPAGCPTVARVALHPSLPACPIPAGQPISESTAKPATRTNSCVFKGLEAMHAYRTKSY
jgi:hypothetical protein